MYTQFPAGESQAENIWLVDLPTENQQSFHSYLISATAIHDEINRRQNLGIQCDDIMILCWMTSF